MENNENINPQATPVQPQAEAIPQQFQQAPNPQQFQQAPNPQQFQQAPNPQQFQQAPNPQQFQQNPNHQQFQQNPNPQQFQQAPNHQLFQQNPNHQQFQQNFSNIANQMKNSFGKMKQDISDAELNQNINNIPIKNEFVRKNALALCAVLSIIFAFLPFIKFTITGGYSEDEIVSLSGIDAIFGASGSIISSLMFLGPILLIALNYIAQLKPYRRIISIAVPAVSIIFEIISFAHVKSAFMALQAGADAANELLEEFGAGSETIKISSSMQIGFVLILISYILTAIVGYLTYYGLNTTNKNNQNNQYNNQNMQMQNFQ